MRPVLVLALCLVLAGVLAGPAFAQSKPRQPTAGQPLVCARLFNWVVRFAPDLSSDRRDLLRRHLEAIMADPRHYAPPSETDCASVLQIMAQEGFDLSDLGLRSFGGVDPVCDSVVPFTRQRIGALTPGQAAEIRRSMRDVNLPMAGPWPQDPLACAILHGELERLDAFATMQEAFDSPPPGPDK